MRTPVYFLLPCVTGHYNEPLDFLIGDSSPPFGAVVLQEDFSMHALDLSVACGASACPSVMIFSAQQWGTINVAGCRVGRKYDFINKSKIDLGIVIQQKGGRFGSKAIGRFDVITCFCTAAGVDEQAEPDGADIAIQEIKETDGVLLCR